jgi:hypothetical protein
MTDIDRFRLIDEVRCACDAQGCSYEQDGAFTREGLAWIFEKARQQIEREARLATRVTCES